MGAMKAKTRIVIYVEPYEEKQAKLVCKRAGFKKVSTWAGVTLRRALAEMPLSPPVMLNPDRTV